MSNNIRLPKPVKQKSSAPSWIKPEALLQASGKEEKNVVLSNAQIIVLSYFNPNTNEVFAADDTRLLAQKRVQALKGDKELKFLDPKTEEPLYAYKTAKRIQKQETVKYSDTELKPERGGTYTNTFIDRHIAYKALEEMQRYASTKGMTMPRARYLRSSYGEKQMGSNLVTINNIFTELEWQYGRNQKGRLFATISVDPAGKFIQPLIFKIASGEEFEFIEENIKMLEKNADFTTMMSNIKPKKSDIPTFKRKDPSMFMATASMKKDAMPGDMTGQPQTMGQPSVDPSTPTAPGTYQAGTQYTNPADGKTYTMKSYDPNTGAVVTSIEGVDMSVPANEVQNLQPVMPTASKKMNAYDFSVNAMAEEMMRKHLRHDMIEDTEHASELNNLAEEERGEVSDDEQLINMLANKKTAMHDYEKNPGDYKKCSYCNGDGEMKNGQKCKHCNGSGYMKKKSSLPPPPLKTVVAGKGAHFSHVPNMSKRWGEIRKGLQEKLRKESNKGDHPFDNAPKNTSREQQEVARLTSVGYKRSTDKNTPNEAGRDPKTHVPTKSSGNVEIGMTEYEEYDRPFQEVQQEMVDRREHFQNQDKLWRKDMKREEVEEYNDGSYKDKSYGLSETSRDGEFENPKLQFEASNDALAKEMIQKKSMGELGEEEKPIQERPIVHKDIKRAPGLEDYKEPETIGEAESKVKEGITKLRKVQEDIKVVKIKLQEAVAPIQKQLQETQKPFNEDLIKKQESLTSYLEMIYSQLSETEDKIAAYSDKIFAVVERSKEETKTVSMAQLLKQLETTDKETFEAVTKVKEAMENETVTSVLERFLYEYPVSKQHELKKVVRKSYDEEGSFNAALAILKDALMGLLTLEVGGDLEVV